MTKKQPVEDTLVLKLKKPLEGIDGESIIELSLREPTAHELDMMTREMAKGSQISGVIKMLSLMTGLETTIIRNMVLSDMMKANKFLENFTLSGQ